MTKTPKTPAIGDILSCGWGYDQTRYDFYQVVGVTAKSVKIRQIAKTYITNHGNGCTTVMPVKDSFTGDPLTKRVGDSEAGYAVRISNYSSARLWDGNPESESGDH